MRKAFNVCYKKELPNTAEMTGVGHKLTTDVPNHRPFEAGSRLCFRVNAFLTFKLGGAVPLSGALSSNSRERARP